MPRYTKQKCTNCGERTYKKYENKPCCLICQVKIENRPDKLKEKFIEKWFK